MDKKYEVHGIPNQYFNIITSPLVQYNAQFVYIKEASSISMMCDSKRTHPFTHAGTYLGSIGIKTGSDRIFLEAGNCLEGMKNVTVNDIPLAIGHRVILAKVAGRPDIVQTIKREDKFTVKLQLAEISLTLVNSDSFFNQHVQLTSYGQYSSQTTMHGLLGSTITNTTYVSARGVNHYYEGTVSDYLIQDENVFGDNFMYNKFIDPLTN